VDLETGERLAAYLAGDLDASAAAELEEELARDPALRAELGRIRRVDDALGRLPAPEPSAEFSERLRHIAGQAARADATAQHPSGDPRRTTAGGGGTDELDRRRASRRRTVVPLAGAAAAAALIGVIGVVTGYGLRGADRETGVIASLDRPIPEVIVRASDNDYSELELGRLAVNVDTTAHVLPGSTAEEAAPVADAIVGRLLRRDSTVPDDGTRTTDGPVPDRAEQAAEETADLAEDVPAVESGPAPDGAGVPAAERCLPALLQQSEQPLVPVYVEVARFEGEPTVVYAFLTEEPESELYRRVEVVAVDQATCDVVGSAQYDRVR
jgi:hypothetical protein